MLVAMLVIFAFSHQSREVSVEISDGIAGSLGVVPPSTAEGEDPILPSDVPLAFDLNIRNWAHIMVFAGLGVTVALFFTSLVTRQGWQDYVFVGTLSILTCVAYATSDELHQFFIPGRNMRAKDIVLDSLGGAIGVLVTIGVWCLVLWLRSRARESKT